MPVTLTDTTPGVPRPGKGVGEWSGEVFEATTTALRVVTGLNRPSDLEGGVPRLDGTIGERGNAGRDVCSATGNIDHSSPPDDFAAYKTGRRGEIRIRVDGGRSVAASYIVLVHTALAFPYSE